MKIHRLLLLNLFVMFIAAGIAPHPASAQAQSKPNILFIMGDDIGWMQPSIYHRGPGGRRNAKHRPHRA